MNNLKEKVMDLEYLINSDKWKQTNGSKDITAVGSKWLYLVNNSKWECIKDTGISVVLKNIDEDVKDDILIDGASAVLGSPESRKKYRDSIGLKSPFISTDVIDTDKWNKEDFEVLHQSVDHTEEEKCDVVKPPLIKSSIWDEDDLVKPSLIRSSIWDEGDIKKEPVIRTEEEDKKWKEIKNIIDYEPEKLHKEPPREITNDINQVCASIAFLLREKNRRYGNSVMEPLGIFNSFVSEKNNESLNGILIRLDDKLKRIKNSKELRKNDVSDIMGYLTFLCIDKGWKDFSDLLD